MKNSSLITQWLKDVKKVSFSRSEGDGPQTKVDSLYINRNEGYELRDLILDYYKEKNIIHKYENYEITYKKIMGYKKGEKVKRNDMLKYLVDSIN